MPKEILFIVLGLAAGTFSGLIGLGGGIIIVPALVFLFGLSQQQAQGTTLALMVPPIGILAAYAYYQQGYVDLKIAALICLGFIIGGWFGAKIAVNLSQNMLQKIFAVSLFLISIKMFFSK
ncbi:MAG TPA: permease [Ignavibacteriales bacterium]|nr:permease [Ignavibacteriales bacterium]